MNHPIGEQLGAVAASEDFEALERAAAQAVGDLFGEGTALEGGVLLADDGRRVLLIDRQRLQRRRFHRPYRLDTALLDRVEQARGAPFLLEGDPAGMFDPGQARPRFTVEPSARILVVPMSASPPFAGVLWLAVRPEFGIDPAHVEPLRLLAESVRKAVLRLLRLEELDRQNEQMRRLHEQMHRAMILTERQALLGIFTSVLGRQFRLPRSYIALVQHESGMLRGEVNTGFDHPLRTRAAPVTEGGNRLVAAMLGGEVQVLEEDPHLHLASFLGDETMLDPAERGVLVPLNIGLKHLGIIYADQPRHDGSPLYKPVLEIFARLAAAALENMGLRARAELRAETDPLTGLRNRYFLDRVLELEIPRVRRYNTPLSLLMIDLCDFKRTNDAYGHLFGDYILRETASLIQANVRAHDMVVRYGGDEFVVLMVNTNQDQADLVRGRIERAFIERNRHQRDEKMMISISVGLRSADASSIENLIHDADQAMYVQKARQKRRQLIGALLEDNLERIENTDRVVGSLCNMLWRKAPYYPEHGRRVAHLALKIGVSLGLPEDELETLALAGLLHDIGKGSLPAEILQKPGPLSPAEIEAMRHHPELGEQFFQGLDHLEPVRPMIRSHHERFDSSVEGPFPSYPDALAADWIPLGARILRLAEMADTMLSDRPYRPALGVEVAEREMRAESGKALDPRLVAILLEDPRWHEGLGRIEQIQFLLG